MGISSAFTMPASSACLRLHMHACMRVSKRMMFMSHGESSDWLISVGFSPETYELAEKTIFGMRTSFMRDCLYACAGPEMGVMLWKQHMYEGVVVFGSWASLAREEEIELRSVEQKKRIWTVQRLGEVLLKAWYKHGIKMADAVWKHTCSQCLLFASFGCHCEKEEIYQRKKKKKREKGKGNWLQKIPSIKRSQACWLLISKGKAGELILSDLEPVHFIWVLLVIMMKV